MSASNADIADLNLHQPNQSQQQQLIAMEQQDPDYTVSPLNWLRSSGASYCIAYLLYSTACFLLLLLLLLPAAASLASQSHGGRALVAATVLLAVVFSLCVLCHCCADFCRLGGLQRVGRLQSRPQQPQCATGTTGEVRSDANSELRARPATAEANSNSAIEVYIGSSLQSRELSQIVLHI